MKFLIDAQLPPALADWIAAHGHDAIHIQDAAAIDATDDDIWRIAREQTRVILTKDRDFAIWAAARRRGPQVVWIRLGNATTGVLIDWLEPKWPEIEQRLAEDVHLIEVRP